MVRIFCNSGSRGSSTGSSSSNFSAEKIKLGSKSEKCIQGLFSDPSLPELKKALRANYSIRTIDLEKCLYRNFGNGFNVEISGCSRANRKCPATLYLWFGDRAPDCIIVKTVRDVGRSAETIGEAVEKLYACSEQLIANGYADRDRLFCLKHDL